MKHKTKMSVGILLLGLGGVLQAQENIVASGGVGTGAGGSASYSIGEAVYTATTGSNGSVAQGLQQAFEISEILGVNRNNIRLETVIHPNPTTNYLTLKTENPKHLNYRLFDNRGKLIKTGRVVHKVTTINVETLPQSVYILTVLKNNQPIKSFKIVKN